MFRVLAEPRWLGALAVAAAFAVAAFFLGQWQWHRYEERRDRADRITAHYDAAPVSLDGRLDTGPMPVTEEWTKVRAQGRYAAGEPLLVRYNSKLPVVVYAPGDVEVRYRIWAASESQAASRQ